MPPVVPPVVEPVVPVVPPPALHQASTSAMACWQSPHEAH
jgi:hypothetical protein